MRNVPLALFVRGTYQAPRKVCGGPIQKRGYLSDFVGGAVLHTEHRVIVCGSCTHEPAQT